MRESSKSYVRKLNNELKSLYGIFKQALKKACVMTWKTATS